MATGSKSKPVASSGNFVESTEYRSSKLMHDQAEMLLGDELGYVSRLRASRNATTALLVVIAGVGVFKVDLFGDPNDQLLLIGPKTLNLVRGLLTIGLICILVGLFKLNRDRSTLSERQKREAGSIRKFKFERGRWGAAMAVMDLKDAYLRGLEQDDPVKVLRFKTRVMMAAFERLARANRMARSRIERGRRWIISGITLLFAAMIVYLWSTRVV